MSEGPDRTDIIAYFLMLALIVLAAIGTGCIVDWIL